jgi:predicted nucleic acid-binding protein
VAVLVDSNVLIDVLDRDPVWGGWSTDQVDRFRTADRLIVNAVIYAEVSVDFARLEEVDRALVAVGAVMEPIPRPALFLAGKAFRSYRARGGGRGGVLPDFFIGAHAAVLGVPLLTRDAGRYRAYFPGLELIAPGR